MGQRASPSSRFIVLNVSTSSKMIMKIYINLFRFFLKALELFECRRGDLYMNAKRTVSSLRSLVITPKI